jgi:hypothetical protein
MVSHNPGENRALCYPSQVWVVSRPSRLYSWIKLPLGVE